MLFTKLICGHFAAGFGVKDFEEKLKLEFVKSRYNLIYHNKFV
jgi:hypothetical protein